MTSIQIDRIDGLSSSVAIKGPCRAATTVNITLSGEQTIDGVAIVTDDRVLVKNQTTASENGIYVVDTGAWRRAKDFSRTNDVKTGTRVYITAGSVGAGIEWAVSTTGTIVVGTTSIAFTTQTPTLLGLGGGAAGIDVLESSTVADIRNQLDAPVYVATRTALKALDTTKDTTALLTESGREGVFIWRAGDYSTLITADTLEGVYVKATAIASTAGSWVRQRENLDVNVAWFGAIGDGATDDSAAFIAADEQANATGGHVVHAGKTYALDSAITFTANVVGEGLMASTLKATSAISGAMVEVSGNGRVISGILFDGNDLAEYCTSVSGANGTIFKSCSFNNATIDGVYSGVTGNNNCIKFDNCRMRFNGRVWNYGTAYTGGAIVASGSATAAGTAGGSVFTLTGLDPTPHALRPHVDTIIIAGHLPYTVTASTSTTISVYPAISATVSGVNFALLKGNGTFIANHTDNNVWHFDNCIMDLNADNGLKDHSLYGATTIGGVWDSNVSYGMHIGKRSASAPNYGACHLNPYFESTGIGAIWYAYALNATIVGQSVAGTAARIRFDSASTVEGPAILAANSIETTNTANINITLKETYFRQSAAAADFSATLPAAPLFGEARPESYTLVLGDIGGKACTVKAASSAKVNSVAGATGVVFRGSYRRLEATWSVQSQSWIVSGPPAILTGSATYNAPNLVDGAGATSTITVTGAALGDTAEVAFGVDLQGIGLTQWVSAADTVSFRLQNETGGPIDLASTTVTAFVTDRT